MSFEHVSVLLEETLENLNIKPNGIYVDGTLGGAGHSYHICERLSKEGHLYGIDQDADAIIAATKRLELFKKQVTIIRDNYSNCKEVLKNESVEKVDGIMLDLGVSSFQLDTIDRGFTYKYDTKLDMRMDQRQRLTAEEIVNKYSQNEIYWMIHNYGEDSLRFQFGMLNPDYPSPIKKKVFTLDHDMYTNKLLEQSEIPVVLDRFHERISNSFERVITNGLRSKMGQIDE
jgi:16S rRNA (cytosine(1402)-N(4))-methyltransferase